MIQGHRTRMIRWREPSRAGSALFDWDFTQQSPGALVLPTGLTFARASSGHTVQTGTSTVLTSGITSNDVGRVGRLSDSHALGLFIEPATTNLYKYSRTPGSAPGPGSSVSYTTGRTGPDGATNATRVQTSSGGYGKYDSSPAAPLADPTYCVLSGWVAQGLGSGAYQLAGSYTGTIGCAVAGTAGASWSRVSSNTYQFPAAQTVYTNIFDGRAHVTIGSSAGARDADVDLIQLEARKYPTSVVVTSGGSTATRAAERLTIDSTRATQSIVGGRIAIRLRFRAITGLSSLTHTSEGQLFESEDHEVGAWIPSNSQQIIVYGSSTQSITASSTITWNAGDLLEFYFELGAGKTLCKWRINGGTWNTAVWSVRDDSFAALSFTGGIDIMNSGGVWQMPGVLERLTTLTPGHF